jgi:uncharacterized protein (DUF885 family)
VPTRDLADELLAAVLAADPLSATLLGLPGHDHRLGDPSADAEARERAVLVDIAERAEAAVAGADDPITAQVVAQQARAGVDRIDSRMVEYTVTDLFIGPAAALMTYLPMVPLADAERVDAFLTRLTEVPRYLAAVADRHRQGVAEGRVPVRRLVDAAVAHLDRYLAVPLAEDTLLAQEIADEAKAAERLRLVEQVLRPAFAAYRDVLADEIAPHGRPDDRPGLCALPGGEAFYAALSRVHTTTALTPDELHRTGLDIIASLRQEYADLGAKVFGDRKSVV